MRCCRWVLLAILTLGALLFGPWPSIRPVSGAQESPPPSNGPAEDGPTSEPDTRSPAQKAEPEKLGPLGSARQTVVTFIAAMEKKEYRTAISALDFSAVAPAPDPFAQVTYAQRLKACIDRLALVDPSQFSDAPKGSPASFPPDADDSSVIVSRGDDGQWRFTAETVAHIDALYEILKDKPLIGERLATTDQPSSDEQTTEATSGKSSEPEAEPDPPATEPPDQLRSARRTMRTLFDSLESTDKSWAVRALDFSGLEAKYPDMGLYTKQQYAFRLKEVIDRLAEIDYANISDAPDDPAFRFPPDAYNQPIVISRGEAGVWRFSADTVAQIDALYEYYKSRKIVNLPEEQKRWYERELVLGNETWRIVTLFVTIFVSLLVGQLLRALLRWRAKVFEDRGRTLTSVVLTTMAKAAVGVSFLIGLNFGIKALILAHEVESLVGTVIDVIFAVVIGYICFRLVDVAVEMLRQLARRTGSTLNDMLVPIVSTSLRLTIIVLAVLEIATAVSDQPPSAVLAGLGAGGLAIGLAAQDTIKNLFGSVMIFADRPFELGDRIVVDGHDGPVETVGFRSTRIRTLDGHLVTIPNGEMASRTIHNIGKRPHIRRVMDIRVASDTPWEKVQRGLEILRQLLADHEGMEEEFPPRVFLHDFFETALNIRAIYWYHPPAYWDYCDFSERLNLQIVQKFCAEGIRFALPSQRLFVTADSEKP